MHPFKYHRAQGVDHAAKAFQAGGDAKFLAGGQTLLAALKMRMAQPDCLVDLGRVAELRGISVTGQSVTIGAMTRHAEVAASTQVGKALPALAELAAHIGDPMVRNMGTLGGSLANNDPAADYPAAVLGLGATVHTSQRHIEADGFFTGLFSTALNPEEIITAVEFRIAQRAAYVKFSHPASRFALVGVFVSEGAGGVRVAVTGAGPCAFRVAAMEQALGRRFAPESLDGIGVDASGFNGDLHATPEYRAHLVGVLARRAVAAALGRP
jgi:carbon-monoxide dehydrogenase medium subunit